jgi:FHA domain-containing protein/type VI secretion system protein
MASNHSPALTLTVSGGDTASRRRIEFDKAGGTIGRAPECTVVLADAQRGISRVQARIEWVDIGYVLTDAGSNALLLNDRVLDGTREARLHDGDRLRIGAYLLEVSIHETDHPDNARHETLMTQTSPEAPAPSAALPNQADWDTKPAAALIPDDWNSTHESLNEDQADAPFRPDPLAATSLLREPAKFGGNGDQALIDALSASDPLLGPGPLATPRRDAAPGVDLPSLQGFQHVSPERAMSAVPTLPPEIAHPAASEPPRPDDGDALGTRAAEQVQAEPARKVALGALAATEQSELDPVISALLNGLGIEAHTVRHIPATDLARLVGGMLREATQGAMAALRSRSIAKRETRIAMTMIEPRDNNPLKFFPDVDAALAQMLGARGAGYLTPEHALRAAFHDIQAHELAVVAGMRAALEHVMARIEPAAIEKSLDAATGLDALIGNRRARLWQRFVDTWDHVARDAGDDFQRTFGEPFSRAYRAQLDVLGPSSE